MTAPPVFDSTAPRVRVGIAAAYPALRAGLRALLLELPGLEVVGEVAALEAFADGPPADVIVADLGDEVDGALEALETVLPSQPAVLLADWAAVTDSAALPPAPRAFLPRTATERELRAAIEAVAAGLSVFSADVLPSLQWASPLPQEDEGTPLTEREREVLELLALGLPNKQIARRLGISEHTAKFHVGAILAKLGAASRTEAVTLAARRGFLAL